MDLLNEIVKDEALRRREFPVAAERIYMAHAGVTPLPKAAADAIHDFAERATRDNQEDDWAKKQVEAARKVGAKILGGHADEIALLGPTSVGISLVANGLPWEPGDEVVYYQDDYPANVYPWSGLAARGVKPIALRPEEPGVIAWDLVEAALTERTKLVALASCHFLSGYRIDVDAIGRNLQKREILFSVDGIQTVGAFPTTVEHVDFLSADSHKWMLGPAAAGLFYVKRSRQDLLRPTLLGSWNVVSPEFVAQEAIEFHPSALRYEPGMLNLPGIIGMTASIQLLLDVGIERVGARLLELRRAILEGARSLGYRLYIEDHDLSPASSDSSRSAIITLIHPDRDMEALQERLVKAKVSASLRRNRAGDAFVRFSPHFYNTLDEIDRVVELLR